ncbi:hypothetical protein HY485_03165, partial [Candidatus Woesearchaeota archaeon]|nr:hypothetical protein [Candidatus Woesearchaeota archaeon]
MTTVIDSGIETFLPGIDFVRNYDDKRCNLYFMGGVPSSWDLGMHFLLAPEGYVLGVSKTPTHLLAFSLTDQGYCSFLSPMQFTFFNEGTAHLKGKDNKYCVITSEKDHIKKFVFLHQTKKREQFPYKLIQRHTVANIEECLKFDLQVSVGREIYNYPRVKKKYPSEFNAHLDRKEKLTKKGQALIKELSDLFHDSESAEFLQDATLEPEDTSLQAQRFFKVNCYENSFKEIAKAIVQAVCITGDELG